MADLITVKFDGLNQIAGEFETLSAASKATMQTVIDAMNVLKNGGWLSPSANDFYRTMDDDLLPGLGRLVNALDTASHTIATVNATMKNGVQAAAAMIPH